MYGLDPIAVIRRVLCAVMIGLAFLVASTADPPPANAGISGVGNPCNLPGVDHLCDVPGDVIGGAASDAGDAIMHGVTAWVTNAAVWVTTQVGALINATASPDVQAAWFRGQYGAMVSIAAMLALPMLLLAVIQAVIRQDPWLMARSALGYLPLAFIFAAGAIVATQLLISITDDLSRDIVSGLGGQSTNLLKSVGDAFSHAIRDPKNDGLPLFGIFLGALVLMVGSLVLWLELVIRDATIYIALFFLPLTFVAMIWPATSRYARRLVEFLIAVVLAKLVIVAIIGLAAAALTNGGLAASAGTAAAHDAAQKGHLFERMVAGGALLVLAAYSPFALLRAIPLVEGAMASVGQSKHQATAAVGAGVGGVQSAAGHFRQAMDRQPESFPASRDSVGTTSGGASSAARSWRETTTDRPGDGIARSYAATTAPSGPPGETSAAQPKREPLSGGLPTDESRPPRSSPPPLHRPRRPDERPPDRSKET
jgi:TrbL/VirB6 plasmid conjugal transfer protein